VAFRDGFIDMGARPVNAVPMDADDIFSKRPEDPLAQLARQDLDRFSVDELRERIALLEAEVSRVRNKIEAAVNHRSTAESLFRR